MSKTRRRSLENLLESEIYSTAEFLITLKNDESVSAKTRFDAAKTLLSLYSSVKRKRERRENIRIEAVDLTSANTGDLPNDSG
ncbi:MAG: hypothetical protein IAE91_12805 [Ignavibacteriaceae bacterium]|nr:hypothetical protein [Ignavibacteriaceae bacterium]